MKIAIIAHLKFAIAEPFAGGLEMHTHLLAKSLRTRGHDVTLFASLDSDAALGVEAICEETSLLETGVAEAGDVAFFREHHAYLRLKTSLRGRSFDIVHNNSLHYLPLTMAATLSAPTVTTLHTPPFCWLESGIRLAHGTNHIVAVSQATADMWQAIVRVDEVIANGIDLGLFPFMPRSAGPGYLVWYGRIVPEKGLYLAIDAARRVGLPLMIAGPRADMRYFDTLISPRLDKSVTYVGHLAHRELARLIGGARAAICTSRWEEPYGLVVAEALASSTPVAAFRRGGRGVPVIPSGEDRALVAAAVIAGGKLVHPPTVWTRTSARPAGRTSGGMADEMKRWLATGTDGAQLHVPAYRHWHCRALWRRALRPILGPGLLMQAEANLSPMPREMPLPGASQS